MDSFGSEPRARGVEPRSDLASFPVFKTKERMQNMSLPIFLLMMSECRCPKHTAEEGQGQGPRTSQVLPAHGSLPARTLTQQGQECACCVLAPDHAPSGEWLLARPRPGQAVAGRGEQLPVTRTPGWGEGPAALLPGQFQPRPSGLGTKLCHYGTGVLATLGLRSATLPAQTPGSYPPGRPCTPGPVTSQLLGWPHSSSVTQAGSCHLAFMLFPLPVSPHQSPSPHATAPPWHTAGWSQEDVCAARGGSAEQTACEAP